MAPRSADGSDEYKSKRDFRRAAEPSPTSGKRPGTSPIFVVQKHDASTLHYDFRLEAGGVLKSWAVPKGPSTDPRKKQLAIRTEDHPLSYADFEGAIPAGQYGAGCVMVWDTGPYRNLTERDGRAVPVEKAVDDGHVTVWLEGEKLRGGYALTRMRPGKREAWLLVKMRDKQADARRNPVSSQSKSVLTGRTLAQICPKKQ